MMTASERREKILCLLRQAEAPMSATALAGLCAVSRQVIVGDVALLRAGGIQIMATPRGYVLDTPTGTEVSVVCAHEDDWLEDELYTVVNLGGTVLDVTVEHSVYGQLSAPLHIASPYDVQDFLHRLRTSGAHPLCDLTDGIHLHRLRCPNMEVQERVLRALEQKGYLVKKE